MNCPTCGKTTSIKGYQSTVFPNSRPFCRSVCACGWYGPAMTMRMAKDIERDEEEMYSTMGDWIRKTNGAQSLMDAYIAGWEGKRDLDKAKKESRKRK